MKCLCKKDCDYSFESSRVIIEKNKIYEYIKCTYNRIGVFIDTYKQNEFYNTKEFGRAIYYFGMNDKRPPRFSDYFYSENEIRQLKLKKLL